MIPHRYGRPFGRVGDEAIKMTCALCNKEREDICTDEKGWSTFLSINIGKYNREVILICREHSDTEIDKFRMKKKYITFNVVA